MVEWEEAGGSFGREASEADGGGVWVVMEWLPTMAGSGQQAMVVFHHQ